MYLDNEVFIYIWAIISPIFKAMDKITPKQYIRLQKKICNPQVIIIVNKLAFEWGTTPEQAAYRLLTEAAMKEFIKRKNEI